MKTNMEMRKVFGKIIARERKKKGLSQNDLAIRMDKERKYISSIECGRVNVTTTYAENIILHIGCTISDILNTNGIPEFDNLNKSIEKE